MNNICDSIMNHYISIWDNYPTVKQWEKGPIFKLSWSFSVLEFRPSQSRKMWTYATCGMSLDAGPLELHLFSPVQCPEHVELLAAVASFHRTEHSLGLEHTVNFGRSWIKGSKCDYGVISLPYLDGPDLQELRLPSLDRVIEFLWLVPITSSEREFKKHNGLEALEQKFDAANFNYLDPNRKSVV